MNEEITLQENETMERTIEVNIEHNGLGVDLGQVFQSVTVDFAPIVAPASVYWDNIQDKPQFAAVATSGNYNDLSNKPDLSTKQDLLVSGTNIKTINNESLLGSGNITIEGGGGSSDAVLYTEQSLTSEQQAQARENISAGTSNFSGSYNDLSNKPAIPTKTSDLSNDSGFISQENDPTVPSWAKQQTKPSYNYSEIGNTPDLSGFITKSVDDLTNYYLKSETYSQVEVNALIGAIQNFHYEIYRTLPAIGNSKVLYLIGPIGSGADKYEEYVWETTIPGSFVKIGDTSIDLSDYINTGDLNKALEGYVSSKDLDNALESYTPTSKLATVATSGDYDDLTNKPTIPAAQIQSDWSQSDNTAKDYIKNKPTIPAAQVNADWNASSGMAQILNKPTIPEGALIVSLTSTGINTFTADYSTFQIAQEAANGRQVYLVDDEIYAIATFIDLNGEEVDYNVVNGYPYGSKLEVNLATYYQVGTTVTVYHSPVNDVVFSGETDPVFTNSPAYGITSNDITNWNNKVTSFQSTPDDTHYPSEKLVKDSLDAKQDGLVSGTTIKTINNESILGSGNITVGGGGTAGTLNTTNTTAQTANASESLGGTVNLHKISKTGDYDDLLNKPTIPDTSGLAPKIPITNHGTSDTTFTLTPNVFHVWGQVSSLTLTLDTASATYLDEFMFQFESGSTATTLSLPSTVKVIGTVEANKTYQCSIVNNIAVIGGV